MKLLHVLAVSSILMMAACSKVSPTNTSSGSSGGTGSANSAPQQIQPVTDSIAKFAGTYRGRLEKDLTLFIDQNGKVFLVLSKDKREDYGQIASTKDFHVLAVAQTVYVVEKMESGNLQVKSLADKRLVAELTLVEEGSTPPPAEQAPNYAFWGYWRGNINGSGSTGFNNGGYSCHSKNVQFWVAKSDEAPGQIDLHIGSDPINCGAQERVSLKYHWFIKDGKVHHRKNYQTEEIGTVSENKIQVRFGDRNIFREPYSESVTIEVREGRLNLSVRAQADNRDSHYYYSFSADLIR